MVKDFFHQLCSQDLPWNCNSTGHSAFPLLRPHHIAHLTKPFTKEEVKQSIFAMPPDPDGLHGGLGLKRRREMSVAFSAKLGWRFIKEPNSSWSQVLASIYIRGERLVLLRKGSVTNIILGGYFSFVGMQ